MYVTSELNPRVRSMKKKSTDHTGGAGIWDRPSGYTTNTSPGPAHTQ
jgi:hypothetical protein